MASGSTYPHQIKNKTCLLVPGWENLTCQHCVGNEELRVKQVQSRRKKKREEGEREKGRKEGREEERKKKKEKEKERESKQAKT